MIGLFAARPPIRYLAPADNAPEKRKTATVTGIADFVSLFGTYDQDYKATETFEEAKQRRREEKKQKHIENQKAALEKWKPSEDTEVRGDPYKTLFIARMSYELTEEDLESEFSRFGKIDRIRIVRNTQNGKSRGYAFIVFDREKDMKAALDRTDGLKINGHRILVDVERGRTVKSWKPMRLGGGKGGRKTAGKAQERDRYSTHRLPPRDYNDRSSSRPSNGYSGSARDSYPSGATDRYSRNRSPPRPDRDGRSDRYERGDRDRHSRSDRSVRHPEPPPVDRHSDRSRQGRQGIGFDRALDPRAAPDRTYHDSHIGFTPASQPALDPRARQPPSAYTNTGVSSVPSAPWLANSSSAVRSSSRERPGYDDDRERDYKRRRY